MNNTPSGTKKHRESTEPESFQTPSSSSSGVELCTELFYAIIPTFFLCFLLTCYSYISLHF